MAKSNSQSLERQIKKLMPESVKRLIVTLLCSRFVGAIVKQLFSRSIKGVSFDFRIVDNKSAAKIFFGVWESAEINFATRFVNDGDTVIELGSSVGVTMATLLSKKRLEKYIAVEGSPRTFTLLKETARKFQNNGQDIILKNKAISYSSMDCVSFAETTLTGSKVASDAHHNDTEKIVEVRTTTLGSLVSENLEKGQSFVLISDIEGAEAEIISLDKTSLEHCASIICELEDTDQASLKEQVDNLLKLGFEMVEYYENVFAFRQIINR